MGSLTVMSLLPALLFFAVDPEGNASSVTPVTLGGFWLAALRFHPLVWVGPFLSGMVLARLTSLSIQSQGSRRPMVGRLIREGLAGESSARCPIDLTDIGEPTKTGWFWKPRLAWIDWMIILLLAGLSLPWSIPYVLSRHNLFLPLQLAIVWECAHGRGILSQLLSSPWLRRWSASSFPLFALQMPTGVWFAYLVLGTREISWVALIAMMIVTIATSRIVATQFDRWISKPVRARLGPGKLPPSETKPYPGRWVDRRTEHPPLAQGGSGLA
jgi:peptidoglycan/LPS O-acetylase OafA/YrhL